MGEYWGSLYGGTQNYGETMFKDEDKEYRYVPKWVGKLLDEEVNIEKLKEEIKNKYKDRRKWFMEDMEMLEDEAARFRAIGAIHKAALEDALKKQSVVLEDVGGKIANGYGEATRLAQEIDKLAKETEKTVERITKLCPHNQLYKIERFLNVVDTFQKMDDETKILLDKLLQVTQESQ